MSSIWVVPRMFCVPAFDAGAFLFLQVKISFKEDGSHEFTGRFAMERNHLSANR